MLVKLGSTSVTQKYIQILSKKAKTGRHLYLLVFIRPMMENIIDMPIIIFIVNIVSLHYLRLIKLLETDIT